MEVDFDKEIDTLLRKAQPGRPVYVGDLASHLDADEISAFAENAMPEKSRALHLAHMADCDRCRKILSNLLVMNAEVVPAAASLGAITIAERALPWYRRLLLFPNLAYVMGSLVLVFAGFLGYTVVRNFGNADLVSQVSDTEVRKGGPNFQDEPAYSEAPVASANSGANAAANTTSSGTFAANANSSRVIAPSDDKGPADNRTDNDFAVDGVTSADSSLPAPPPAAAAQPAPRDLPARERDEVGKAKKEDKAAGGVQLQELSKNDSTLKMQSPGAGSQSQSQSGPMNRNERQYNRQLENLDRRAAAKRSVKRVEEGSSGGQKVVGGRTFERKESVWYDTAYQGRPTINVRRGSAEFDRLDGGLRSIANSLSGTLVVVWGTKAYRIQ